MLYDQCNAQTNKGCVCVSDLKVSLRETMAKINATYACVRKSIAW